MNEHICPLNCPNRHAFCHVFCPRHELYREEVGERRKKQKKEAAVKSYQKDQRSKYLEITKQHKTWKGRKTKS